MNADEKDYNYEDLGDVRRVRRLQGDRSFVLYITGTPDTTNEQRSLVERLGPVWANRAGALGLNFRVVSMWQTENSHQQHVKPLSSLTVRMQALMESNFFVCVIGNDYGFALSKSNSNFQSCFDEAKRHFVWLDEHRLKKHLSQLELEIDTALGATSKNRGSGHMKNVFFFLTPQAAPRSIPGQLAIEEELLVGIKREVRSSGWPCYLYNEAAIRKELLDAMAAAFPQEKSPFNVNVRPLMEDRLLYFDEQDSDHIDTVETHMLTFPGTPLVILGPQGVGKSTIAAGWLLKFIEDQDGEPPLVYYESIQEKRTIYQIMSNVVEFVGERYGVRYPYGGSRGGGNLESLIELHEVYTSHIALACEGTRQFVLILENIHNIAGMGTSYLLRKTNALGMMRDRTQPFIILTGHYDWYKHEFGEKGSHERDYSFKMLFTTDPASLNEESQDKFITTYLQAYYKRISRAQKEKLCSNALSKNPMFLRLSCDLLLECTSKQDVKERLSVISGTSSYIALYQLTIDACVFELQAFVDPRVSAEQVVTSALKFICASVCGARDVELEHYCGVSGYQLTMMLQKLDRLFVRVGAALFFAHSSLGDYVRQKIVPSEPEFNQLRVEVAEVKLRMLQGCGFQDPVVCMEALHQLAAADAWEKVLQLTSTVQVLGTILPSRHRDLRDLWIKCQDEIRRVDTVEQVFTDLQKVLEDDPSNKAVPYAMATLIEVALELRRFYQGLKLHKFAEPLARAVEDESLVEEINVFGLQIRQRLDGLDNLQFCEKILSYYRVRQKVSFGLVLALQTRGILMYREGSFEEATDMFSECATLAESLGAFRVQGQALLDFAMAVYPKDASKSRQTLYKLNKFSERHNDLLLRETVLFVQAVNAFQENLFEECDTAAEKCLQLATHIGDGLFVTWATLVIGMSQMATNYNSPSRKSLEQTMTRAKLYKAQSAFDVANRVLMLHGGKSALGQGALPHNIPLEIGPQGFKDPPMPEPIGAHAGIDMLDNLRFLTDRLDSIRRVGAFYSAICGVPLPKLVSFVEVLSPVYSCRVQDVEHILAADAVISHSERNDRDDREVFRAFLRDHTASIKHSWKLDEPAAELLVDYVESYIRRELTGSSEAGEYRHAVLQQRIDQLHKHVFKTAPERISLKQHARIEAVCKRLVKKAKREELDLFYPQNAWAADEVDMFGLDSACWASLGPNASYGAISFIINRDILKHPDTFCLVNSPRMLLSGKSKVLRPWAAEFPHFQSPSTEPDPPPPGKGSDFRETHASRNKARLVGLMLQSETVSAFNKHKINADVPGWELYAAREIKGQAQMANQIDPGKHASIEDWYLNTSVDQRFQCFLPPSVPLALVSAMIVVQDMVEESFVEKMSKLKLADGRKMKDLLVLCKTREDSLAWQREYFRAAWLVTSGKDEQFEEFQPHAGEARKRAAPTKQLVSTGCFPDKKRERERRMEREMDEALDREYQKRQEEKRAVLLKHEEHLVAVKDHQQNLFDLLSLFGEST